MSRATSTTIRFTSRQLFQRADAAQAEMVGLHVEHRADIAVAHAHAGAEQAAARDFQHGDVHRGSLSTIRVATGPVMSPGDRALAVDVDAVGRGEADVVAGQLLDVGQHPRGRGLAVGAR